MKNVLDATAILVSICALIVSLRTCHVEERNATMVRRQELQGHLDRAHDLLAGVEGATEISNRKLLPEVIEQVEREIQRVLAIDPRSAAAHRLRGVCYRASGQDSLALHEFRTAVSITPSFARAYLNLGTALRDGGDVAGAMTAYQTAHQRGSRHDKFLAELALARLAFDKGENDEALRRASHATQLEPDHFLGHLYTGLVNARLKNHREAAKSCERAEMLRPRYSPITLCIGKAYRHMAEADPSMESRSQRLSRSDRASAAAVADDSLSPEAREERGRVLLLLDRPREARDELEIATDLYRSDDVDSQNRLARKIEWIEKTAHSP